MIWDAPTAACISEILKVVTQFRIHIFVVVAFRQAFELETIAFTAGIVVAWRAVAVTSPVSYGLDRGRQSFLVGDHGVLPIVI